MSLVERALKKFQESRATTPGQGVMAPAPMAPLPRFEEPPAAAAREAAPTPARVLHIDREGLRAKRLLPPPNQERLIADQYRQIKRPLIASAFGRGAERIERGQLIMIASALPGEGKTFTSLNLALSMALEPDVSVLLVDADVAKPHISELLGAAQEPGLLDLLRDESLALESVVLPTDIPRLSFLPAGKPSSTATELLASVRMQRIAEHLAATHSNRIVLFDSPPLLLTSESRVVASLTGQVAIVVRAGETPQRAVLDALDLLGEGRHVAFILNQSDEVHAGYYEYYGQRVEGNGAAAS
ncbi:MAG TPA: AAA family ATPase [Steroidobacteraceae bacterium]